MQDLLRYLSQKMDVNYICKEGIPAMWKLLIQKKPHWRYVVSPDWLLEYDMEFLVKDLKVDWTKTTPEGYDVLSYLKDKGFALDSLNRTSPFYLIASFMKEIN